ncbi:uncharacterized protein B0I36DRAFT_351714 [Microdochium trichocladiopsis]|uniref:Small nuclear ribonucleoprotein Prp3 C-terminal domain-containing protein n=1 Tax=Microdochium trichocladiopsis TaxID=1682393 RepID=A0A9P8XZ18_9PEZI|nr:uncharacterized protein B0I36DRAFT_351714 [Microdochium trichocladiopsis]KAH7025743.1 hypothetical protein B0I36DRAFT_351714 [Microdochium trichocladiopsis]
MGSSGWNMLPPELLEMQLAQIDLLMAMYPSAEELVVSDDTRRAIERIRQVCSDGEAAGAAAAAAAAVTKDIYLDLKLGRLQTDGGGEVELEITIPLGFDREHGSTSTSSSPPDEPPRVRTRMRQPAWASRAEAASINEGIPMEDDILGIIEYIREAAAEKYTESLTSAAGDEDDKAQSSSSAAARSSTTMTLGSTTSYSATTKDLEPLVRVWFYFPSISTRSKRDDLVRNAPAYGLTGFLLAGKPGLLCLEGGTRAVDEYMRFIKTESWGDIPAHHKKVSERYREESAGGGGGGGAAVGRVFADMTEITDTVGGERRGERANRGDMKAIEAWLTERGLGEAFTKVLI